jgi:Ca-activated chloride channel family protein
MNRKEHTMNTRKTAFLTILLVIPIILSGCAGSIDTSKSYGRAVINRGSIVPADTIRVNEYLNYYEQRFPEPDHGALGLDLRLGNPLLPISRNEAWLQIGIQARSGTETIRTPLNLALVLDTSGSMADREKMPYLKASLEVFLGSLKPEDRIAIITYNTHAQVLRSSQPVGDGRWISNVVRQLRPDGYTNLYDGLIAGFEQVSDHYDLRFNNRVILLTDGIANQGVTDPQRIAGDALAYNDQGIYLSTIGLGYDLDDDLLSTLAYQGHGAYHFVDSAEEMDKIFRQEVQGLVEKVAEELTLVLQPLNGVQLAWVSGFEGTTPAAGARIKLPDMGAGESQVVMVRMLVPDGPAGPVQLASVGLEFQDVFAARPASVQATLSASRTNSGPRDALIDVEVQRNATIVQSAEALIQIDGLFNQGRFLEAWTLAHDMEFRLREVAAAAGDPQMIEDADLFQRYQLTLASALGYDPARESPRESSGQEQRWGSGETGNPTQLPEIEVR